MKGSLIILSWAVLGVLLGMFDIFPHEITQSNASVYILYLLLLLVGMGVGFDIKALYVLREMKFNILLVPFGLLAGSLIGGALAGMLLGLTALQGMTIAAGFGYYSLPSLLITEWGDPELASLTLLANMLREAVTLMFPAFLVKIGGKLAPIMSSGAAAMDTCLPNIAKHCGERYALIGIFSGMVLTLFVPILVPFLLSLQ